MAIHGIQNAKPGSEDFLLHGMVQFGSGCLRRLSHVHACSKESIPKFMQTTSVPVIDIMLNCDVRGPGKATPRKDPPLRYEVTLCRSHPEGCKCVLSWTHSASVLQLRQSCTRLAAKLVTSIDRCCGAPQLGANLFA